LVAEVLSCSKALKSEYRLLFEFERRNNLNQKQKLYAGNGNCFCNKPQRVSGIEEFKNENDGVSEFYGSYYKNSQNLNSFYINSHNTNTYKSMKTIKSQKSQKSLYSKKSSKD